MKKVRFSLKTKSAIGIIVISALLIVSAMGISLKVFSDYVRKQYTDQAKNVTETVIQLIDKDELRNVSETMKKDSGYQDTLDLLQKIKDSNGVKYLYIQKQDGDTVTYLFDTEEEGEANDLGYQEAAVDAASRQPGEAISNINNTPYGWLITYYNPVMDGNQEIAVIGADLSMNNVIANMQQFLLNCLVILLILTAVIVIIRLWWVRRTLVSPILGLSDAARHFVEHQNDSWMEEKLDRLNIHSGDEVEALSDSIRNMDEEMKKYLKNFTAVTAEKERISTELSVATQIQADMLPRIFPPYPDRKEFDLFAAMSPAKEVGGDLYDFYMTDEDHLAVVIGDVSGKGVPAALFMVISKTLIKNYATMGLPVDEVFTKTNHDLCEGNDAELFTTAWIGIYEISTGKLSFADAGHETAIVLKPDGTVSYLKPLKKKIVLAAMDGIRYAENVSSLEKGDILFIYTDGVPEATNAHDELYGMERLEAVIAKHRGGNPQQLLKEVRADVDAFVGEAPQFDDLTMLALEIKSQKTAED